MSEQSDGRMVLSRSAARKRFEATCNSGTIRPEIKDGFLKYVFSEKGDLLFNIITAIDSVYPATMSQLALIPYASQLRIDAAKMAKDGVVAKRVENSEKRLLAPLNNIEKALLALSPKEYFTAQARVRNEVLLELDARFKDEIDAIVGEKIDLKDNLLTSILYKVIKEQKADIVNVVSRNAGGAERFDFGVSLLMEVIRHVTGGSLPDEADAEYYMKAALLACVSFNSTEKNELNSSLSGRVDKCYADNAVPTLFQYNKQLDIFELTDLAKAIFKMTGEGRTELPGEYKRWKKQHKGR